MDVNDGVYNGIKYFWEIIVAIFSGVISYVGYKFKKHRDDVATDKKMLLDHDTTIKIFNERLNSLNSDIEEIKDYLKKILFKL